MKVYVVIKGEQSEGGYVEGVYSNRDNAILASLNQKPHFDGGWEKEDDMGMYWTNGCDFVEVVEKEVS